jgi:hypothetical protein
VTRRMFRGVTPLAASAVCVLLLRGGPLLDAQTSFAYDLDGDGINDTNLALRACADAASSLCLRVESIRVPSRDIRLADTPNTCETSIQRLGDKIHLIGDYTNDRLSEVSALFCRNPTPSLSVVDIASATILGSTTAPAGQVASYTDFPHDPAGRQHPFLANSYDDEAPQSPRRWEFLCIFRPDRDSSRECGPGFSRASQLPTNPPHGSFRETGGYLQDVDGDGWEDIHLLYEYLTLTISPNSLTTLVQTEFDVARNEPDAALNFHAGRQYGTHSAVNAPDGSLRDVMIGGTPLSAFNDPSCNVSRFVGVLQSSPGAPSTRTLAWTKYYGFQSAIFASFDPRQPISVLRQPDVENGCIQRFGDSRSTVDGVPVLVFNVFNQTAPASTCLQEQFAYYNGDVAGWLACVAKNLKATGTWNVEVLREADGAPLFRSANTYVWGWVSGIMPGDDVVYLIESVPGVVPFDRSDGSRAVLDARTMTPSGWQRVLRVPVAERPVVSRAQPAGARGAASYTGYSFLRTTDYDRDGLLDVQFNDGSWVGYSGTVGTLTVKVKPAITAVAWSSLSGARTVGSRLTNAAAHGTAASSEALSGDGYFEFSVGEDNVALAAGLTHGGAPADQADLDFAIVFAADGTMSASELGLDKGALGTYRRGDVFRVGVFGGVVLYLRDGIILRKGDLVVGGPMRFAATLASAAAVIADVKVTAPMPTPPMSVASLTVAEDPGAAHTVFAPVTLRATAAGGATPLQFKWILVDGSVSRLMQDWSASPTVTWVPRATGDGYSWKVYARSAGHSGDEYDSVASSAPITIR